MLFGLQIAIVFAALVYSLFSIMLMTLIIDGWLYTVSLQNVDTTSVASMIDKLIVLLIKL